MTIRKDRKSVVRYSRHNLPVGRPEVPSGPSKVIQAGDTSADSIVKRFGVVVSRGVLNTAALPPGMLPGADVASYDALNVTDVPVTRRRGANIVDVANAIKDARIKDVIVKDIANAPRKPMVKSSPEGEAQGAKAPADPV